ncbi:methyltransferase domain-containing protein [Chitinophaga sp. Cy-1792]|uniref:methyltransferase domain-containing protein n=1 Tax=Chitinophaga sp. Cy-1792 TaxID=2608339 RepID=UPI00141E8E84|nr:methyltransferase domain-containing protein [Chitinophaga sp. Cy-1792]NIG55283.1 class I SAM-dependent methyltransferase [Chitinophaga sp. Cy-1792]
MLKKLLKKFRREVVAPANWENLRSVKPLSTKFGFDRGTPVDRYYIESFLQQNIAAIHGHVLEIAESSYSKQFGQHVTKFEVLHTKQDSHVTIVGDLTDIASLPENQIDSFICTQTFNFIYDYKAAIQGAYYLLKPGGTLLATLAGVSQISAYDMQRWGDYWRFTTKSAQQVFDEVFGEGNVTVKAYGNVLAATALFHGISAEEVTKEELDFNDPVYPVIISVIATKNTNGKA